MTATYNDHSLPSSDMYSIMSNIVDKCKYKFLSTFNLPFSTGYIISFFQLPSFKYYISKLGGWGVKACTDNADTGQGVQNLEKLADVILEHSPILK